MLVGVGSSVWRFGCQFGQSVYSARLFLLPLPTTRTVLEVALGGSNKFIPLWPLNFGRAQKKVNSAHQTQFTSLLVQRWSSATLTNRWQSLIEKNQYDPPENRCYDLVFIDLDSLLDHDSWCLRECSNELDRVSRIETLGPIAARQIFGKRQALRHFVRWCGLLNTIKFSLSEPFRRALPPPIKGKILENFVRKVCNDWEDDWETNPGLPRKRSSKFPFETRWFMNSCDRLSEIKSSNAHWLYIH